MTIKLAILASTNGTDMIGIIDAITKKKLDAKITCLISNKKDCSAMQKAMNNHIDSLFIDPKAKERECFDKEVSNELEKRHPDLILLIGYMRILSPWFVKTYQNRIMNIHPSLLPAFAGKSDINIHEELLVRGCKITGCTLHFVDEGADTGPIIIQKCVKIDEYDSLDTLKSKVQLKEVESLIEGITLFQKGMLKVEGKIVRISH